jgi:hypothetical protein
MKVLGSLKLLRCVNIKDELFIKLPIFEWVLHEKDFKRSWLRRVHTVLLSFIFFSFIEWLKSRTSSHHDTTLSSIQTPREHAFMLIIWYYMYLVTLEESVTYWSRSRCLNNVSICIIINATIFIYYNKYLQ